MNNKITESDLKEVLSYNPCTGVFTRLCNATNGVKKGDKAIGVDSLGYGRIMVKGVLCKAHRLAFLYMTGKLPIMCVDHINGCVNDNRWVNLREVTVRENGRNRKLSSNNRTGLTGVVWLNRSRRFRAQIKIDGVYIYLGQHLDFFEACCSRLSANNKYGFHKNHSRKTG